MGEMADMMIDGTLCHTCGVYLDTGPGGGFPRFCHVCQPKEPCPVCSRSFRGARGVADHVSAKHPERATGASEGEE